MVSERNYARSVGVAFGHSSCESVWAFRLGRNFIDALADVQADSACQRADVAFLGALSCRHAPHRGCSGLGSQRVQRLSRIGKTATCQNNNPQVLLDFYCVEQRPGC